MCTSDICLGLIAIIFPPLPVWVKRGLCSADSLINLALCCLGFVPGLLHAWYIIASTPDTYDEYDVVTGDPESGRRGSRVTYYYVSQDAPQPQVHGYGSAQQPGHVNYGTVAAAQGQGESAGPAAGDVEVPPTYNDAIRGDNKVQRS